MREPEPTPEDITAVIAARRDALRAEEIDELAAQDPAWREAALAVYGYDEEARRVLNAYWDDVVWARQRRWGTA